MKISFDGVYVKAGISQSETARNAYLQSGKRPEFREEFSFPQIFFLTAGKP